MDSRLDNSNPPAQKLDKSNPKDPQADIREAIISAAAFNTKHISTYEPSMKNLIIDINMLVEQMTEIFQAHQLELLSELLGQKLWVDVADDKKRNKTKWRIEAVPVSVIKRKIGELNG